MTMKNKEALDFFGKMSMDKTKGPKSVKLAHSSDYSDIDASFILKYADSKSSLLDLGSGTGLIVNKIYNNVKNITAVEPFSGFTQYIVSSPKVQIVNTSLSDFIPSTNAEYDIITIFAVMHYFNSEEAIQIYTKYLPLLAKRGKLIIKNQFGTTEDVVVEGYSEEQKSNYYAEYRHIDKEVQFLKIIGYTNIEVVDIYPSECNRWSNTHFYAIVAEK